MYRSQDWMNGSSLVGVDLLAAEFAAYFYMRRWTILFLAPISREDDG